MRKSLCCTRACPKARFGSPWSWAGAALVGVGLVALGDQSLAQPPQDSGDQSASPKSDADEEEKLPDDVTLWRKKNYYSARHVADPRLKAAVAYLGEHFARTTSGQRNEKAAVLLAKLLESKAPPGSTGAGGYPGMTGHSMDDSSSGGFSSAGMPEGPAGTSGGGEGGSGPPAAKQAKQPAKPLDPELIAAIVDALAANGSKPARKTIYDLLAGTFRADSDRAAAEAAIKALLAHASPEAQELLLTILTSPEKVRARGPGERPGVGPMAQGNPFAPPSGPGDGYSSAGYPGSGFSGSGGFGGGNMGKLTSTDLQTMALALVEQLAPEAFRVQVAKYYVDARTRPEQRGALGRFLLASNPENVSAQVVLHASPVTDKDARAVIERSFVTYSSGALSVLMGVPFQPQPVVSRRGSGYPGGGGMPSGASGPGGAPSGHSAPDSGGPPSSAGSSSDMPPPGASGGGPDGSSRPSGSSSYGMPSDPGGGSMMYPGMMPGAAGMPGMPGMPGAQGTGFGQRGSRGGLGRSLGVDPNAPYRVAQQLWGRQFTTSIAAELDQIDSINQDAARIVLASTIPTDAVRAKLYQTLRRYHSDGPMALEDAGLGASVFSDPGFLLVLKAMPRKDVPAQETTTRVFRSRRRTEGAGGASGQPSGGSYGQSQPSSGSYGSSQPYSGQGPGQPRAKDADKPEYAWMAASEDFARAICDQLLAPGRRRVGPGGASADLSESRPVEIPTGPEVAVLSEYRFEWPTSLADRGKLSGVPLDAMIIHYVRVQGRSTPTKLIGYFKRKLGGPAEHRADVGYWLETVRNVEDTNRRRSIDVLIARREERDSGRTARPGGGNMGGPYGSMPGYGPPGRSGESDSPYGAPPGAPGSARRGQPGEKSEKDVTGDLIIEILSIEIKNPAASEETATSSKSAKTASRDEG